MAKFIIGTSAFEPASNEEPQGYIVHTEFPKFIAKLDLHDDLEEAIEVTWKEKCTEEELEQALIDADEAVNYWNEENWKLDNSKN